ncbi:unnamed protein product [Hyaloperonospora brassicae]|uniref:MABP domain-containing protein n=1 Tax=Hyaloperonospora brassicae TaxID=162125 RepID=A0AAV0T5Y4_HYABA|nr:unnamed protein product [Hyaloperonospora brassicae]
MPATPSTDIVVVYQRQEFYVPTPSTSNQKTLPVELLQCQLLSLVGVLPDEQLLVCSCTGHVLYGPNKSDVTAIPVSTERRSRFFLYSGTHSGSLEVPELADDWQQICTKSTFGDAAVVQPAFRAVVPQSRDDVLATLICEPCARTCTTGFQRVSPIEWNASRTLTSRFISDVTLVAGAIDMAAPSGYEKLPVELNYSASGDYVYLCVQRGGPLALTQIHVLLEPQGAQDVAATADESIACTPERVVEVDRSCGGTTGDGIGPTIRIGYDSVQLVGNMEQLETLAITDIAVVVGDQPAPSPSYVKVTRNLNEGVAGSLPVFLYYRLAALGGFVCDSGREHSDFGECLFASRHLTGVSSILDLDEQRLNVPRLALATERKHGDALVLKEHYRQREPGMLERLQSGLQRAQSYESRAMQLEALKRIPVDELQERARANPSPLPHAQDELVKQLLHWFKHEFFTWMNQPRCSVCNNERTRSVRIEGPSTAEEIAGQAGRVEVYQCLACGAFTRFPRYNDPVKLLDTRTGRCGEWANCFTLCCRAMGFEARYVLDVTDHVWTEVYSEHYKRWLHCDSCEDQLDCPLTYEVGWGKKLSYIFSFGHDEVVDTTRRYTCKWSDTLTRRQDVSEEWLIKTISQLNHSLRERQSPEREVILTSRAESEREELLRGRFVQKTEVKGRVSGSAEWKDQRNEAGKQEEELIDNEPSTAKVSTTVPLAEIMQSVCKNLVVGCHFAECANPFCFTGRARLSYPDVPSDANERAAQAIQIVTTLSSMGFSPASLMMVLCPSKSTELRQFLWKNQPLLYLPLQDFPMTCTDGSMHLIDISGNGNHANNTQHCALRKPFRIQRPNQILDTCNEAQGQRDDNAYGMQLIGGKQLSVQGPSLTCRTNFMLSLLVRFDPNKSRGVVESDTVNVLAGRVGLPESSSSIEFRMHWKFLERRFFCELQCHNKLVETTVPPTSLSIVGGYAHISIARVENAVALYINGTETLVLEGACGLSTNDVCIQGPTSTCPSVVTVTSHVAMIPVKTLQEAETFCTGMKMYVPATPLKAYGADGERPGETCLEAAAGAGSEYRIAKILMWGDDFFDGLQFVYEKIVQEDSATVASGSPATVFGTLVGNSSAKRRSSQPTASLDLLPDESIIRVGGRKGAWVDRMTLHTNFGRSVTCGGKGGDSFIVPASADSEIRFISFRIGDHLSDACAFVLPESPLKAREGKLIQDLLDILSSEEHSTRLNAISAGNIAQQPEEAKFQRIRASNKFFASTVGVLVSDVANSFMSWCGFEETSDQGDQFFTFKPSRLQDEPTAQRLAAEAQKRIHLLKNAGLQ